MWNNPDMQTWYVREQRRDLLAGLEQARLAAACEQSLALTRRAARPLGRTLFSVGAWLLRYGKAELPATIYSPPARPVELN